MIFTKWGRELDRNKPLQEYPRPQFVRDSYINLNGMWDFTVSKKASLPASTEYGYKICVPFSPESVLSGVDIDKVNGDDYLFYKRNFTLPDGFNKGRVFVNFGAVDQIAVVYLNGSEIGTHHGGYTAFTFELTDFLVSGENEIVVRAQDFTEANSYSRGKQRTKRGGIWYTAQSGIWQTVWLESTPQEYLKCVRITPDYDNEQVHFDYEGADSVEVMIYDGDELIADTTEKTVKLPDFKSWSPESPFLYNVVFKACGERIKSYFGMRKFSTGVDSKGIKRLFLNNKPYFHNGLLDQGYYPDGLLTPPSNAAMKFDVEYAKTAGFNMLRKHIKIEPMLWYHYCDVNGIIVWQDMINGGGNYGLEISVLPFINITLDDTNYKTFKRTDKFAREIYYEELTDMINALYNCPCIALWVPYNEGWGQFDSSYAYDFIKKLDKTRIIDTASGWHDMGRSDVISKHIYFTPIKVRQGERPYVLSEFGGLGIRVDGHTFSNKMFCYKVYKGKNSITKAYSRLFNNTIIPQIDSGLSATVYTQLTDVEEELNGLLTYDREVEKIDKNALKAINERISIND